MTIVSRCNPSKENSFRPVAEMVTRLQRKELRGRRTRADARASAVGRAVGHQKHLRDDACRFLAETQRLEVCPAVAQVATLLGP